MAISMSAMAEHVAAFVRIVNASQSKELHAWTVDSLERAFAWANVMEMLVEKATKDGDSALAELGDTLSKHLHGAALPSLDAHGSGITASTLRNATRQLCDAILTSPWLHSHPRRPELTTRVFKKLIELKRVDSGSSLASHSDLFVQQIQARQSGESMGRVAKILGRGCKHTRVQVGSKAVEIPSFASFQLEQRTLRLKSLARTLQTNVCAANSLSESRSASEDASTIREFLSRVEDQLRRSDKDVVESIVWCVVLHWPSDHAAIRTEMIKMIESWMLSQPANSLFALEPWLAAMFASHSEAFTRQYLDVLLSSGLCVLDRQDLRSRIGALVLQGAKLEAAVEARLSLLDVVTHEQLISYITE